jgi:hypothetical protein
MTTLYVYHGFLEATPAAGTTLLAFGGWWEVSAGGGGGGPAGDEPTAIFAARQKAQRMLTHTEPRFWMQW